ncbi:hypothetical protein LTR85_004334 [Meristemomyces frigidus]|nr:hypothetical protein LTR85_004334 [Meristemomyces frigidus]
MEASPLKKLPAELRNRIYEMALQHEDAIIIRTDGAFDELSASGLPLALTATCREIRNDTLKMFYANNAFHFHTTLPNYATSGFKQWVNNMNANNMSQIHHLCLELGATNKDTWREPISISMDYPAIFRRLGVWLPQLRVPTAILHSGFTVPYSGYDVTTKSLRITFPAHGLGAALTCVQAAVQEEKAKLQQELGACDPKREFGSSMFSRQELLWHAEARLDDLQPVLEGLVRKLFARTL